MFAVRIDFPQGEHPGENNNSSKKMFSSTTGSDAEERIEISIGNPSVENVRGVLRLFRPVRREKGSGKSKLDAAPQASGDTGEEGVTSSGSHADAKLPRRRSTTLCLLAVPEHMTPSEVFKFFGAFLQSIHRIRFVRQGASDPDGAVERVDDGAAPAALPVTTCTSCVLDFREQEVADEFFLAYDGRKYSSLEDDVCRCVFVRRCDLPDKHRPPSLPTSPSAASKGKREAQPLVSDRDEDKAGADEDERVAEIETEVPTCPVCLERLDAHITGIATTLCNHDFHPECLKKCTMTSCPVCRYSQTGEDESQGTLCQHCGGQEDLWMCIICGHVGCGRYAGGELSAIPNLLSLSLPLSPSLPPSLFLSLAENSLSPSPSPHDALQTCLC